jgi:hypothetical protein
MTRRGAEEALTAFEANQSEALLRSRWDSDYAASVVPVLVSCLGLDDTEILQRALSALVRIGPAAESAGDAVIGLMFHRDPLICEVATHTLGFVCLHCPERAIKPLTQVASDPKLQKAALFSLIAVGRGAASATKVFVDSFESRDACIRRLAVRGLAQSGASRDACGPVLARALKDRNGRVRDAARRLELTLAEKE